VGRTSNARAHERCQNGSLRNVVVAHTITAVIPFRDENPTTIPPIATVSFIVLNLLAWVFLEGLGTERAVAAAVCNYGLIPAEILHRAHPGVAYSLGPGMECVITAGAHWWTVVTSMFM